MSHLTTFKNNSLVNTNKETLCKSLAEMDIILDYENKNIKNSWINKDCDAAMIYKGKRISVGINFKMNEDGTELVEVEGDFYGTGLNQEQLTNRIAQIYQKNDIINKCRSQRWFVSEENIKVNEEGEYVIQASRFA